MKPEEQRFALLRLHSEGQPVWLCGRSVSHRGGLSAGTADLGGAGGEGGFAFSPAAPLQGRGGTQGVLRSAHRRSGRFVALTSGRGSSFCISLCFRNTLGCFPAHEELQSISKKRCLSRELPGVFGNSLQAKALSFPFLLFCLRSDLSTKAHFVP